MAKSEYPRHPTMAAVDDHDWEEAFEAAMDRVDSLEKEADRLRDDLGRAGRRDPCFIGYCRALGAVVEAVGANPDRAGPILDACYWLASVGRRDPARAAILRVIWGEWGGVIPSRYSARLRRETGLSRQAVFAQVHKLLDDPLIGRTITRAGHGPGENGGQDDDDPDRQAED